MCVFDQNNQREKTTHNNDESKLYEGKERNNKHQPKII